MPWSEWNYGNKIGFWELHTAISLADLFACLLRFLKNIDILAINTQSQQGVNDVFEKRVLLVDNKSIVCWKWISDFVHLSLMTVLFMYDYIVMRQHSNVAYLVCSNPFYITTNIK